MRRNQPASVNPIYVEPFSGQPAARVAKTTTGFSGHRSLNIQQRTACKCDLPWLFERYLLLRLVRIACCSIVGKLTRGYAGMYRNDGTAWTQTVWGLSMRRRQGKPHWAVRNASPPYLHALVFWYTACPDNINVHASQSLSNAMIDFYLLLMDHIAILITSSKRQDCVTLIRGSRNLAMRFDLPATEW
jgi:hypothetical protein